MKSRMTRQRRVILEALQQTEAHPTAEELHLLVRRRLPRISLGTVYRNLEVLSESGAIRRLDLGGGRRRYDGNVADDHYHARCLGCGRIDDVAHAVVTRLEYSAECVRDFQVLGHQLTFMGLCEACRDRASRED